MLLGSGHNHDEFWQGIPVRGGMREQSSARHPENGMPLEPAASTSARIGRPVRVALVEDDPAHMARLCAIVDADPRLSRGWTAAGVAEANRMIEGAAIDVVLVDLGLPDGSGLTVIRRLLERVPGCEVIVFTLFGDDERVIASLEAGATGYLTKDAAPAEIVAGILQVRAGGAPMSPPIARRLLRRFRSAPTDARVSDPPDANGDAPGLSDRENQVLQFIAKGFTTEEIARLMGLSPNTVLTYVKRVYRKLSVHSRSEAIFEARQSGLL